MNKVNAIVLAGTSGTDPFELDGRKINKQYIEICGKTLVERVVDAALDAERVGRVYVVGDVEKLIPILKDKPDQRCVLVSQYSTIMENVCETFVRNIIPDIVDEYARRYSAMDLIGKYSALREERVLIIMSDILFPSAETIDKWLLQCTDDSDVEIGVTRKEAFDAFLKKYNLYDYDENKFKTAFIPMGNVKIRISNINIIKPLKISKQLYTLGQKWYENRTFIDDQGKTNISAWRRYSRLLCIYARKCISSNVIRGIQVYRGLINAILQGVFLIRAKNRDKGCRLVNIKDSERAISWFCGLNFKFNISDSLSMVDLDRIDTYRYLKDKGVFDHIYKADAR